MINVAAKNKPGSNLHSRLDLLRLNWRYSIMIVVTGGAGFIGSALIWQLNEAGYEDIVVIDQLGLGDKWKNLLKRKFTNVLSIEEGLDWLIDNAEQVDVMFHMGACSSTTERDADYLMSNNLHYSMDLWNICVQEDIPFIYASSAATYGSEERIFNDEHDSVIKLKPINKYGYSKYLFDRWALGQDKTPPAWFGLKFFNVYGPQEYHKGSQASVVFHAYPQIKEGGKLKLFKSHRKDIADGMQMRDFVYVKDIVKVMQHLWEKRDNAKSGVYNLGCGKANSFLDLGKAVFSALDKPATIDWIAMPEALQGQYQYFTEANLDKLRRDGNYHEDFTSLEDGVYDYVSNYLEKEDPYL